ncbi:chloride channel protein [Nocardia sp. NPDC019395]|uniref:chloride channel protein n=1 Tax=Nocardia sp. NPDC019395 TaxID=3154686 RepID=UPI0033D24966
MTGRPGPDRRWGALCAALLLAAVAAGLGAVALRALLEVVTGILLGSVLPLEPMADGLWHAPAGPLGGRGALLVPLLVAAGTVTAVLVSRTGGPQVNGTDGVIGAVNTRDLDGLTVRGAVAKLSGTAITLGTGGSGGTEGPVAQVAASLGAAIARRLRLTETDASLVVAAALGAGVGALFQAPIGGAVLSAELLRRRGMHWRAVLYAAPATPIAFGIFVLVYGYHPMFEITDFGAPWDPAATGVLAAVGLACALLARVYVGTFHRVGRLLRPARKRPVVTAALAGALVGTVGIFVPMALGTGYGTVSLALSQNEVLALPLWLLLALPFVKIATTAVTLHAGGVGGVFGPAIVIGGTVGALCWRLAVEAGIDPGPAAACTIAGVAACLGASVRAPLAATVFAVEIAGYLVPPAGLVIAVALAAVCTRDITLFPSQETARSRGPYRQMAHSVMLNADDMRRRAGPNRLIGGIRSRRRNRSDSSREGCPMEPEATPGLPDLADLPLDELLDDHRPEVNRAVRIALRRRAAVGIVFAGHSAGGGT